jgi:hypothetical protein
LECLKWVFLKNNKYRKIKRKKGINEIKRFLKYILEIILTVVSENIIKNKPIKKVIIFNFE